MISPVFSEILLITILLLSTFKVLAKGGTDCHCPSGCPVVPTPCSVPCERGWSGPSCHRRNIALGRPTEQTGAFNDTADCPPPDPTFGPLVCGVKGSNLAVDGDSDHTYWHGSCSHTIPGNYTARWSVDLGGRHLVSHVVIHTDEDLEPFLNIFQLFVDGQWCQDWTQVNDAALVADITCTRPLYGSNLTIESKPGPINRWWPVLDLCEVEIYECSDSWFGIDCDKKCHCRNESEVCDKITGHCASGCAVGRAGPDCQIINVALNKATSQSSTHGQHLSDAHLTVDGDPNSCLKLDPGQPLTFWSVDLGMPTDVNSIRIYNEKNHINEMKGFKVTVDGKLCYQSSTYTAPPSVVDIKCQEDLIGSNVSISMTSSLSGQHSLSFCEVEVYECNDYTFGVNCDNRCNCYDVTEVCNKTTGHCNSGCPAGWTGVNCTQASSIKQKTAPSLSQTLPLTVEDEHDSQCGRGTYLLDGKCELCSNCVNNTCNARDGRCIIGCNAGYTRPMCDEECPFKYYGLHCFFECGTCRNNRTCHPVSGQCLDGCAENFTTPFCKKCVAGLHGKNCDKNCGECKGSNRCYQDGSCPNGCLHNTLPPKCTDCPKGKYGQNCDRTCGRCRYGENCDRLTGICKQGCINGWTGDMCLSCDVGFYSDGCYECGHCANNKTCNATSGLCPEGCMSGWSSPYCNRDCPQGFYGDECKYTCGHCADNSRCDSRTGHCPPIGCTEGYHGPFCNEVCSHGTYGPNCRFKCGMCLHNVTCDRVNGSCPRDKCMSGYKNPRCQKECSKWRFGHRCLNSCTNCKFGCQSANGICLQGGCLPGWKGEICQEAISNGKPGVVAAAVIVPIIVIGTVVGIVVWRWRRWRKKQPEHEMTEVSTQGRRSRYNER